MEKSLRSAIIGKINSPKKNIIPAFKKLSLTCFVSVFVFLVGFVPEKSLAQLVTSITINSVAPTSICQGGNFVVKISSFAVGSNTYTVQLSDNSGSFESPTDIGSANIPGDADNDIITATISSNTSSGTGYSIRVVSGLINSDPEAIIVNAVPAKPTGTDGERCGTGTVDISATSTGNTINWYTTATGGTALDNTASGATFTTPSISSTTTYYAEAVTAAGCLSATREAVLATVNPAPAKPTGTDGERCGTGTVNLSATSTGNTINWYTTATGGTTLDNTASGATFTTPSISSTTTYYAEAVTAAGCVSATREAVVATVNPAPAKPTGTDGERCGTGTINLSATSTGNTINWYTTATGGTALDNTASGATFTTPSISSTTAYYAEAVTAAGCVSAERTAVTATVNPQPAAPTGTNGSRCGTGTVDISATSTGNTIDWYTASTGGSPIANTASDATFTTPSISTTTTYYAQALTSGGCLSSTRTAVTATVNTVPAAPTGTNGSRCGTGTVALSAASTGNTINWFTASTGGTSIATTASGATFTTPSISSTTTYYAEALTSASCVSATRTAVVATVNTVPAAPIGTNGSRCGTGTVTISATPGTGETIDWYAASTGGTALLTGNTSYTTPTITTTTTYYAQARNTTTGCISATRTAVVATVNAVPAAPTGTNGERCGSGTVNISATSSTGNTINWYTASTGGTPLNPNPISSGGTFTTPSISATTVYYAEAVSSSGGCISSSRTAVTATINANFTPTITVSPVSPVCSGTLVTLTGSSFSSIATNNIEGDFSKAQGSPWSGASANNSNTKTNTDWAGSNGGTFPPGNNTYNSNAPGGSNKRFMITTGNGGTGIPIISPIFSTIGMRTASLDYYTAFNFNPGAVGKVEISVNNGAWVLLRQYGPYTTATNLGITDNGFVIETIPLNNYLGQSHLRVRYNYTGSSGSNWAIDDVNLISTYQSINYTWVSGETTQSIQRTLTNTTSSPITVPFSLTTSTGGCTANNTSINIIVNPVATVTSAASGNVCSGVAQNYPITSGVTGATVTYSWSRGAVTGISNTAVSGQTSNPITEALTNTTTSPINVVYTITPSVGSCPGTPFTRTVTVNPSPTITSAASGNICSGVAQNYTITSGVAGATYSWSRSAVAGISNTAVSGQESNPITEVLTNTTNAPINVIYTITPRANGCSGAPFTRTVTVNPSPTITSAATGNICSGVAQNYTITTAVTGAIFSWSRSAVTGISNTTVSGQTSNPITETLTNTTGSAIDVVYTITPSANGCTGTPFTRTVTVNPAPTITSAASGNICSGVAQNYTITSSPAGATFSWSRSAITGISNTAVTGQTSNPITETLTNTTGSAIDIVYTITLSANGCSGAPFTRTVTVNPSPTITSAPSGTACSGVAQNYTIISAVTGASFSWSRSAITGISNTAVTGQTSNPITETLTNTTGSAIDVVYTITPSANGCSGAPFTRTVTVNPSPEITSVASGTVCSGVAQDYIITSGTTGATFSWSRSAVTGISNTAVTGQTSNPITETLTNTTESAIDVVYTITPSVSGCTGTPFIYTMTVNPAPVISNLTSTVCSGGQFTVTPADAPSGTTYTWEAPSYTGSVSGGSAESNQSSIAQTLTLNGNGSTSGTATYTVTPTSGSCSGTPFTLVVSVTVNSWIGSIASNGIYDWNTGANWCSGQVPTATMNAIIPSGLPLSKYPVLSDDAEVKSLAIEDGAKVTLSGETLAIYGVVSGSGEFVGDKNASLELNGSNTSTLNFDQNDSITNVVKNLTVNSGTYTLSNRLYVLNELASNGGTLNSNGKLTIRSTSIDSTARVAEVKGAINGNVTVERFIPSRRAYRYISPSVTTTTSIKDNWMEGGNNSSINPPFDNPEPGYGTNITGPNPATNGFDPTITTNSSLFTFDNSTQEWIPVPNTKGTLSAGVGYSLMVRGGRKTDMRTNSPTPTNTILRATGKLETGTVISTFDDVGDDKYIFIGNPYASPVDFQKIQANSTNIGTTYWAWDPRVGTRGVYVPYNIITGSNNASSEVNQIIQSGQAFFVRTTGSSPSIKFAESYKTTGNTAVFRNPSATTKLSIQLLLNLNEGLENNADGVVAFFDKDFTTAIGNEDSYKFTNLDENLAINSNGTSLSIEGRPPVSADDSIPLKMWQFRQNSYYLKLTGSNFSPEVTAFVKDNYLKKETPVDLSSVILLPFTIDTAVAASSARDRFSIVFKAGTALPVTLTKVNANQKDDGIQVDWTAETETNIESYEIEKSVNGQQFEKVTAMPAKGNNSTTQTYSWLDENPNTGSNFYRIKVIEKSGAVKYSNVVKVNIAWGNSSLTVFPNPLKGNVIQVKLSNMEKGRYTAVLYNTLGQKLYSNIINHTARSGTYTISLGRLISKGTYTLHVTKGDTTINERVIVE